jgi:hypothetical protein
MCFDDHIEAVVAQQLDICRNRAAIARNVAAGRPLVPSQQSSLIVMRTVVMCHGSIAVTEARSSGPSGKPELS